MSVDKEIMAELQKIFAGSKSQKGVSLTLPPPCSAELKATFVEYKTKKYLVRKFEVQQRFTNPAGGFQGGFISAAFDDTFGPLSYLVMKKPTTSLDLVTNFIRPVYPPDELVIRADVISRGFSSIHMSAQAHNQKGKLIATSTTNMVVVGNRPG